MATTEAPPRPGTIWQEAGRGGPPDRPAAPDPTPEPDPAPAAGRPAASVPGAELAERQPDDVAVPDDTSTELVPVDPPDQRVDIWVQVLSRLDAKRRPILPPWVTNRDDLELVVRWAAGYVGYQCAFHGLRLPFVYAPRVVYRAPWGALRGSKNVVAWIYDFEARPLLHAAVRREDSDEWDRISARMDRHQKARWTLVGLATAAAVAGGVAVTVLVPALAAALGAAGVLGLARLGSSKDKPIITHAVYKAQQFKLSGDMILDALGSLSGLPQVSAAIKNPNYRWFPAPIVRDGPGWRATIDLPGGVTALAIMDKKEELASGLRRPSGAVWPEGDPEEHPGRLILWVGDRAMSKARQPAWPLLHAGQADIFAGLPFGFDQRFRPVVLEVMFGNVLIGSVPRHGKTVAMRDLILGAALDPIVELHQHELKGTGDLESTSKLAHRHSSGPGDPVTLDLAMASIREVHSYLTERADTIKNLSVAVCPDRKVTRALAERRELRLHPVVLAIDEVQELFESEHRAEAITLLKAIIKRGPALGIMLFLSTQKPDKEALPTAISANMIIRMCGRVTDQISNDQILGTSAYKAGMRGTLFVKADKGLFVVRDGGDHQIVRAGDVNSAQAAKVGARAYAVREQLGLLTGQAIGEAAPKVPDRFQLLRDIDRVWPAGEDRMWSAELVDLLADLDQSRYGSWDGKALGSQLAALAVKTRQMQKTKGGIEANRRGLDRKTLSDALAGVGDDWEDEEGEAAA